MVAPEMASEATFGETVSFDVQVKGDTTDSSVFVAIYKENMELIKVKELPAQSVENKSFTNASEAKYLKAFIFDSNLVPKCIHAAKTKN